MGRKNDGRRKGHIVGSPQRERTNSTLIEPGQPLPWVHRGLLILIFVLLWLFASRQVGSMDAGFHLKAGNDILAGHGWPDTDRFTYTLNDHPYIDTSWGYQVILAVAEKVAGAPGMIVLHLIILTGLFAVLYRTARLVPVDASTLVLSMGAGVLACEMRYEVRPELLSYLFLAVLLFFLHRHVHGHRTVLWLLPLLLWFWSNSHSLFILGWVALLCVVIGLWLRDRKADRQLLLWSGLSFLAPLANPYGLKGVLFPFTLMTRFQKGNPFAESIGEFISPFTLNISDQFPFYPHWPVWTFRVLVVLTILTLFPLLKRRYWWALLLCMAFLPLSVTMIRNIPVLVVIALPLIAWALPLTGLWNISGMRKQRARLFGHIILGTAALLLIMLGVSVVTDAYYLSTRRSDRFGWGWNRQVLPLEAVEYLDRMQLEGPMLNHLNFGGYLMWARSEPVFIDGRLEVVGEEFYQHYLHILSSSAALEAAVLRYGFRYIIFPYAINPRLLNQLSNDVRWRLTHVDHIAAVFVREDPTARSLENTVSVKKTASPAAIGGILPGLNGSPRQSPFKRRMMNLFSRRTFPSEDYSRGLFHYFRGEYQQAENWFRAALAHGGEPYYEVYLNLGSALFKQNKLDRAADCYRVVLKEEPGNKLARERLTAISHSRM